MLRAIKLRLYPNKTQQIYISKLLGSYRFIFNQCLDLKKKKYDEDINFGLKDLGTFFHQDLTKQIEYEWLKEHNTKVLKQAIVNLLDAYKNFFKKKSGFPKFKSKHDNKLSCRFPVDAISKLNDYQTNRLTLTKQIKDIKFKSSTKYKNYLSKHKENIKSATLSKTKSGNYFLSILVDGDLMNQLSEPKNKLIGIDLGIKDFIISSEGTKYENLKIKRSNKHKIAKLHRELSKKQKGSSNKNKSRIKLARFYEKLNNKKENYLHHVSNQLVNENQIIAIESLNVKGMMKNHKLARSIQELSLFKFKEMLRYKSEWYNRDLIEIDQWFPSSKLCHCCGWKNKELTLKDREWICQECGVIHDRDINAAINIKNEGLRIYNKNKIGLRQPEFTPLEIDR